MIFKVISFGSEIQLEWFSNERNKFEQSRGLSSCFSRINRVDRPTVIRWRSKRIFDSTGDHGRDCFEPTEKSKPGRESCWVGERNVTTRTRYQRVFGIHFALGYRQSFARPIRTRSLIAWLSIPGRYFCVNLPSIRFLVSVLEDFLTLISSIYFHACSEVAPFEPWPEEKKKQDSEQQTRLVE